MNNSLRAPSIDNVSEDDLSYNRATNVSIFWMSSPSTLGGNVLNLTNVSVISGNESQVCENYLFPFPLKPDTESHPLNAWKNGSPLHFSKPIFVAKS